MMDVFDDFRSDQRNRTSRVVEELAPFVKDLSIYLRSCEDAVFECGGADHTVDDMAI